jgi:hypothetical protein
LTYFQIRPAAGCCAPAPPAASSCATLGRRYCRTGLDAALDLALCAPVQVQAGTAILTTRSLVR